MKDIELIRTKKEGYYRFKLEVFNGSIEITQWDNSMGTGLSKETVQ